jgi:hypothetical protein
VAIYFMLKKNEKVKETPVIDITQESKAIK